MYLLNIENIKQEMNNFKSSLNNISAVLINKMYENKDLYMKDMKELIKLSDLENNNNIFTLFDKYNNTLIDKIYTTVNDIIPKTQQEYYNKIIIEFKKELLSSFEDNNKLDPNKLFDIINNKYDNFTKYLSDNLTNNIIQTEQRLNCNFVQLQELGIKNNILQENINDELLKYISKFNNSSLKGAIGENHLYKVLVDEFPTSEIINSSNLTGCGDFLLNRKFKDTILIETKNYNDNVKISETEKFLRDCTNNKCHGIFLSQYSGIINKENFQIDFHNGKILIYIHNMNYDNYKLKLGIQIIDFLYDKINSLNEKTINLSPDILKNINDEYQIHITIKERMISDLKDYYKKTMDNFLKLNLPELDKILVKYFANSKKISYLCEFCSKYSSESLKSLARHKTICKKKLLINKDSINEIKNDINSDEK